MTAMHGSALPWLLDRVAQHAQATPTRVAINDGARTLDHGALWRDARRFAARLRALGVVPGDRLALILPNGVEAVIATYGGWLAGAAVVPLNAQAKARDFEPWLRHADARVVVHEADHRDASLAVAALDPRPHAIVTRGAAAGALDWDSALAIEAAPPAPPSGPDALALILYTSGTTGRPKGVMLSHANLAANVQAIIAYLGLGASDSTVSVLPFYYSYGSSVLHTHLAAGARVVLEANTVFPHLVVEAIARERVTGFSGVPSTFLLLLNRVTLADHDLSSLRYLTQAGGAMAPAVAARLRAALPDARLFVMYGQTEATARLCYLPPERLDDKPGSVGIPVAGVEVEIRDEHGGVLRADEVGEVHVRGANVMQGYWQDPALTREVLDRGWLRTGDMGRLDADGFLFLSGRRSDMIKTGAHRVHPQDVEEVIAELPEVAEVAVVGVDDALLGQVIKACIVPVDGAGLVPDRIKAHCRERLAGYKIPKFVELLSTLPKTASGKIRRAELGTPSTPGEVS
ncbi:MAG: AMP-dependent synthetase [Lysobacteraceae bacterium]|nr:MAG: AMP-dependent synthetase [Xanthomonadaceae bacterium]